MDGLAQLFRRQTKRLASGASRLCFPTPERGSTLTWVVILTIVSIGMASLVVDVGYIPTEAAGKEIRFSMHPSFQTM